MYEATEIPGVYWMLDAEAYCWEDFLGNMVGAYSHIEDAVQDLREYVEELEKDLEDD